MNSSIANSQECPLGTSWYICHNSFRGCCAVDPCAQPDNQCPSTSDSPTPTSASRSAAASEAAASTSSTEQEQQTSPLANANISTRAGSAIETFASISSGQTVFITVTRDPSPTSQPSEVTTVNSSSVRKSISYGGAIAGGVVGGVVILALAGFVLLHFWRKRQAKVTRRATLPAVYADADMSEHIGGTADAAVAPQTNRVAVVDEKTNNNCLAQQLDSTMIIPTTEMGGDPLGNIPELPAFEPCADPFATPSDPARDGTSSNDQSEVEGIANNSGDAGTHIMSWSQYNSMGTRCPSSRLSQPHGAPDGAAAVWSNLDLENKLEKDL